MAWLLARSRTVRLALATLPALLAIGVVTIALAGLGGAPRPSRADVAPAQGFRATVLGWSSWYGSYDLAGPGRAWCIDHGSHAPDGDFGYVPTAVPDVSADTQAAMSWALTAHPAADGIDAAATMLVLHDLMGATYPSGRLDVHQMSPADLAGFGGHEATVLDRARAIKDDALAHRHLRAPFTLTAEAPMVAAGQNADLLVRLTDVNGAPVDRAMVHVHADGAALLGPGHGPTGSDGTARFTYRAGLGANRFAAVAVATDPSLAAWGPTTSPAQRVARPATVDVGARASFEVTPPDGGIELDKTDAATGEPLAGAVFDLAFDADGDDRYETPAGQITSDLEPVVTAGLAPGNYQLTETSAPPGYEPLVEPFVVTVPPGQVVDVDVANQPRSTVAFEKVPRGEADPAQVTLAGAVFVVTGPHDPPPPGPIIGDYPQGGDGAIDPAPEVGRCTTDVEGRCGLVGGALSGGRQYCYREEVAPPGFGRAEPGCFRAGPAAAIELVEIAEPSTFTPVDAVKRDAVTDETLAGAVYDLYRRSGDDTLPAPSPPDDASPLDGHTWVGRATSDDRGRLVWPRQIPGHRYCAVEHRAPEGYARRAEPVCSEEVRPGVAVHLTLRDQPLGPPATVTPPPGATPPGPRAPTPTPGGASSRSSPLPVAGGGSRSLALMGAGLVVLGGCARGAAARGRARASREGRDHAEVV
jgi:hypothetical protein